MGNGITSSSFKNNGSNDELVKAICKLPIYPYKSTMNDLSPIRDKNYYRDYVNNNSIDAIFNGKTFTITTEDYSAYSNQSRSRNSFSAYNDYDRGVSFDKYDEVRNLRRIST
uniref:Uncharacterized protein n=1 Tax=Chromulina nebulosa TaxID=96789 RepID=A0A7S0XE95_9STRA